MKDRNKIMRFFGLHPQNDVRRRFAFTLAEGATHVDNSNNKCKFAFTLAEVLVTLGIIGVVAVLTVPNVISSYQKKVYVTQLQKGYAQLEQAFQLAMADDEVDDIRDTTLWSYYKDPRPGDGSSVDLSEFVEHLKKYMKISKFCNPTNTPLEDSCFGIDYVNLDGVPDPGGLEKKRRLKVYTPNGFTYYFSSLYEQENNPLLGGWFGGSIEIDVNGDKKPNRMGRDFFTMVLLFDGSLIFPGSQLWNDAGLNHWSADARWPCLLFTDNGHAGDYCGGRIFDNGWVMDY